MLQWMGGSRRKVTTSRNSTQKRQKQYFEQRKRQQQQQQQNSSELESYSDKKIPCRPRNEYNRSLDVLSLLNLSKNGQDQTSRFAEVQGSGNLEGEHATPNYQTSHGPNTIQTKTKDPCPSEHVEIRETRIASNHLEKTSCAQGHPDASKRNDGKDPMTTTDHIDHKLFVVDMLGDDGQNNSSRRSFVHEEHVAFSVEGLGKVGMETPVHSPQQPTRNFSYGCPRQAKSSKGSHFSKNLNWSVEDQFRELDDLAVDTDISTGGCSSMTPPYLGELYGISKPKRMVGREPVRHDVEDFFSDDEFYDNRVEQDAYEWHEKPSFLDDRFLENNCGLSWKNGPCNLDSNMVNHVRSWKHEKTDLPFEGLYIQKKRGGAKAAGSFNIPELSSPYKHQMEHDYDFTSSNIARQDSCLSRPVWHGGTTNPSFNPTRRRKRRGDEVYFGSPLNKFSMKNNTFSHTKGLDAWHQESVVCSGRDNRMSEFSTPGDDWLYGEQTERASPFGSKLWTENPLVSYFNPKFYVDDKPSASRSTDDAFSGNFFSDNIASQRVSPGHSSPVILNTDVECRHPGSFEGLFKEKKDSPKIQFQERVSTRENASATIPFISSEDNCDQSNCSASTNRTSTNVSDSKDDHSHFEESKVKTPEMTPGPNAVLSPVWSEGGSSSVEMPQKLEDCDGLKKDFSPKQSEHKEEPGCRKGILKKEQTATWVDLAK